MLGASARGANCGATLPASYHNGYRPLKASSPPSDAGAASVANDEFAVERDRPRVPPPLRLPKDLSLKPIRGTSKVPPVMFQRAKPAPVASNMFEAYPAEVRDEARAPSRELGEKERNGTLAGRSLPRNSKHIKYDVTHVDTGSPRAAISYEKDADVKVSFKVLADQRGGGGSTAANRAHGRASAIAAQEREMRFTKEQGVLDTIVRNQVSLESKYTKEVRIRQESARTPVYMRVANMKTRATCLLTPPYLLY